MKEFRRRTRPGGEADLEEFARFAFGEDEEEKVEENVFNQGRSGAFPLTDEEQEIFVIKTLEDRLGSDHMWRSVWGGLGLAAAFIVACFVHWHTVGTCLCTTLLACQGNIWLVLQHTPKSFSLCLRN